MACRLVTLKFLTAAVVPNICRSLTVGMQSQTEVG